eukprot:6965201-Prymnesium_polylepis.1
MMRTEEWVGVVDGLQSGAAERGCRAGLERGIARQVVTAARTDGTTGHAGRHGAPSGQTGTYRPHWNS